MGDRNRFLFFDGCWGMCNHSCGMDTVRKQLQASRLLVFRLVCLWLCTQRNVTWEAEPHLAPSGAGQHRCVRSSIKLLRECRVVGRTRMQSVIEEAAANDFSRRKHVMYRYVRNGIASRYKDSDGGSLAAPTMPHARTGPLRKTVWRSQRVSSSLRLRHMSAAET